RKSVVGKPILYKTTKEFLVQFGLKDLNELPSLKEFEELRRLAFQDADEPAVGVEAPAAKPAESETVPAEASASEPQNLEPQTAEPQPSETPSEPHHE